MTTTTDTDLERGLGQLVDAVDELVVLSTGGTLADQGLETLTHRCRTVLGADVALVAVRRGGRAEVVADDDPGLDRQELRRQVVLAEASLDDPVIDGRPDLPPPPDDPAIVVLHHRHLRRLVVPVPGPGVVATLTVARPWPFAAPEVEVAMAFAELAALVLSWSGRSARDAVGRLLAVGLALQIVHRWTDDDRLRDVVETAIAQLDHAVLEIRLRGV